MILTEILPDLSYKILDRIKDVPRLGEETFQTGQFSPDAISTGIEVVRTFTTLARNRGFTWVEAVATSAVREAANGGDLIEAIERETGIRVRVVTGQEEARLLYLAEVMHLQKTGRPIPQLNLARFSLKDIMAVEKLLRETSPKRRNEIPGLDPKRADLLLPATIVLRTIMERLDIGELNVSDKAIREGLLYDFIDRHRDGIQAEQDIPNVRRRNVMHLARSCQYDAVHAHHVAKLCLQLFDQTASIHKMGEREREWLEYAAILHDIGYLINSRQHHKHTYYVIKNSDLAGFTVDEIELIANVARYHRRALPEDDHRNLKDLDAKHRETLTVLGGILRLADALDRSHFGVIQSMRCTATPEALEINLTATDDAALELWAARDRKELLAQGLKRAIRLTKATAPGEFDA